MKQQSEIKSQIQVQILKNDKVIKTLSCKEEKDIQRTFDNAYDIAGGLWNGKDVFSVKII